MSNPNLHPPQTIFDDLTPEELAFLPHCANTILNHLDRHLDSSKTNHDNVSKILAFRWVLTKNIQLTHN